MADDERIQALLARLAAAEERAARAEEQVRALEASCSELLARQQAERVAETGQLAAGIVHELNNPLTAVTIFSESLSQKLERAPTADAGDLEKLRTIREAGDRLLRFSRELTQFARPLAERPKDLDLAEVLEQALRGCDGAIRRGRAQVVRRLAPSVPPIHGVRASLVVAFSNLVANAAQALHNDGGTITIELTADASGGGAIARVQDDGRGMEPEVRRQLFRPFFSTKTDGETGLGLCIAQRIVLRHGGTLDVASVPGAGTTVTVALPRRLPS